MARQIPLLPDITDEQKTEAEEQIKARQKETDFDIREYPIEVIVKKFTDKLENDKSELFIPDYQREMIWKNHQQARFIESILLNLPIPYLYVADVTSGEDEGRIEIVDGSQRIRTLVRFLNNELTLERLEILDKLNGFRYENLSLSRQMRFQRKTLRMIELIEVDEEARRQLFDRLNSGGTNLKNMEKRLGSRDGVFMDFIRDISTNERFHMLCPISDARQKHREYEEMALRFFAYADSYTDFQKSVDDFLNKYLKTMNEGFDREACLEKFNTMLSFVERFFPLGFKKSANNFSVPRIRFEAISVGVSHAIAQGCSEPADMAWLESHDFITLTRSDASNSRPKVINRIHFVRDNLLGRAPSMESDDDSEVYTDDDTDK